MRDFDRYLTVQELIDELEQLPDKSLPIAVYVINEMTGDNYDAGRIGSIDDTMENRVDLNTYVQF